MSEGQNTDRIVDVLGFNHRGKGGSNVLEKARAKVQKERDDKHEEECADRMRQAIDTDEKRVNLRKEYEGKDKKAGKELNKLLSKIVAFGDGRPAEEASEESEESNSEN